MMEQRPHLEPIQEESEREDETDENKTGEEEEEEEEEEEDEEEEERDFNVQLDVDRRETEEVEVESNDEDDDAPLRVMRPRRLSRSVSYESFSQMQSTVSTFAVDLSEEAAPPRKPNLVFKKWSTSGELGIMDEPFPPWLVGLMVNIEEATTHQLVVE
ncbi:hypothetical protein PAMA_004981 [Pampus argenteus]